MNAPWHRAGLLPADGIRRLLAQKQQMQQAAAGKAPERMVQATLRAVAQLSRGNAPRRTLAPRVFALVRQMLSRKKWNGRDARPD